MLNFVVAPVHTQSCPSIRHTMLFKPTIFALAAAHIVSAQALPGCHPAWVYRGDYYAGSYVSAMRTTSTTNGTAVSIMKNFKCTSGLQSLLSHCPTFDPSVVTHADAAWSDEGECSITAPPPINPSPTNNPTRVNSGIICPNAWKSGTVYQEGDVTEVDGIVYRCVWDLKCGHSDYNPGGPSPLWQYAWYRLDSCQVLTSVPETGCPPEWNGDVDYFENDKVSVPINQMNSLVYQCSGDVHDSRYW